MYSVSKVDTAVKKFNNYVEIYIEALNTRLSEIKEQLEIKNYIDQIKQGNNDLILEISDRLIKLDNTLEPKLKIVKFLIDNKATNAEQFNKAFSSIMNSDLISNFDNNHNDLIDSKRKIELNIEQCNFILNGSDYNFDYYIKLLEQSGLIEQEKIDVLSNEALKTVEYQVKTDKQTVDEQVVNNNSDEVGNINRQVVSSVELEKRYNDVMNKADAVISSNYYLLEKNNSNQLSYKKQFLDILYSNNQSILDEQFICYDELLTLVVLDLINDKKYIETEMKKIDNHETTLDNIEAIELLLSDIEVKVQRAYEVSDSLNKDVKEEVNPNASNVLFLLDNEGNPNIEFIQFDKETKKKCLSLIEKLENGMFDAGKGIKHSKLQTDNIIKYDVYINKNARVCCSYVRLKDDTVLIVALADLKQIYDLSNHICKKHNNVIEKYINMSKEDIEKCIIEQEPLTISFKESLAVKGDVK